MTSSDWLQNALIGIPILLLSLTVHEFFHAWTAHKYGDDTAKDLGRLSLNPLVHLDLWGSIVMVASGFRFGWAKPVPVNPMNLRSPRTADIWISAAGPLSNLGLAIIFGIVFRMLTTMTGIPEAAYLVIARGVLINLLLAFFNLIPLFPLDGSHILRNLVPPDMEATIDKFNMVSPLLLLALIYFGAIGIVLGPVIYPLIPLIGGNAIIAYL